MTSGADQDRNSGIGRRAFLGASLGATVALGGATGCAQTSAGRREPARLERSPVVETAAGRARGAYDGAVYAFKGVPYAASTGGAMRFQPPEAREPWTGVREAMDIGLRCPVRQSTAQAEYVVLDRREPAGEDCLCLNVWTPGLGDGGKRPVMLWLHGGGFSGGSAGSPLYDGARLAAGQDVVVVGANHRLNLWGYLHLYQTGLSRFERTANIGMLDVVAALAWIRDNIEAFGGDPGNVTVFGQSGGGGKTSTLLGMPAGQGLFHKAIVMSGSQVRSADEEASLRNLETFLGLFDLRLDQAERLLDIPYYDLRDALGRADLAWAPVMDGRTIPAHNFDPVATPISADVPMMIGSMETEITWNVQTQYDPLDDETLVVMVGRALGSDAATARRVIGVYKDGRPRASNLDLYLILASDLSGFRVGTDTQAERKAEQGRAAVYKYYFDWYSPVAEGKLRCMHLMDVPFIFDNTEIGAPLVGRGPELAEMARRFSGAAAAFARTGDPNGAGLPAWEPFDTARRATLIVNPRMELAYDPHRAERLARTGAA